MVAQFNGANRKRVTANIILVANAFVWYLIAFKILRELIVQINSTSSETLLIIGINAGAIAIAGLIGSFIFDKFKSRRNFLFLWTASGVLLSIVPLGLNLQNFSDIAVISLAFGIYFGLGMPATMGYHSFLTKIEERAKFGGYAFLIIGIVFPIVGLSVFDNIQASCLVLALVRLLGLGIFYLLPKETQIKKEPQEKIKYKDILFNRPFVFYFVPWCMFTLINYMTIPIQQTIFATEVDFNMLMAVEFVVTAIFALISGFVADKFGRKRLAIIGFIMLGIGYAVIGLFANSNLHLTGIIYVFTDGVAWGIFYVLFLFTIWGDLAQGKNADKIYFLGALPYLSSYFMQLLLHPYLAGIQKEMIFSFASVFLFLAVLPLIYAPETLPEKIMKDRDLRSYIEKAKKKATQDAEKGAKKSITKNKKEDKYQEAKKLAEKYY